MYEIVLRFEDHDEVRLTDCDGYGDGDRLTINHRRFVVTSIEEPRLAGALRRYILQPLADPEPR